MSNSTLPPDGGPVPHAIMLRAGPLLSGALITFLLFGISIGQLYLYNVRFSNDKFLIQFSVYVIFLLDVFESAATWTLAWHALCTGWGLASFLIYPGWSLSALLVVVGVISAWVQIFYAWRIHAMINWKLVPIVVILLSLAQVAILISLAVDFAKIKSLVLSREPLFVRTIIWIAGATLADAIISASMVYMFYSAKKSANGRIENPVNRLIRLTVETGIITTLCTAAKLVCFLASPNTFFHIIFLLTLSKVYSIAFMTSLNSRTMDPSQSSMTQWAWELSTFDGTDTTVSVAQVQSADVEGDHPEKKVFEKQDGETPEISRTGTATSAAQVQSTDVVEGHRPVLTTESSTTGTTMSVFQASNSVEEHHQPEEQAE